MAKKIVRGDAILEDIYVSILESSSVDDIRRLLGKTFEASTSSMSRFEGGVAPVSWVGFEFSPDAGYGDCYYHAGPRTGAGMVIPLSLRVDGEQPMARARYREGEVYRDVMRMRAPHAIEESEEQRFARWPPHVPRTDLDPWPREEPPGGDPDVTRMLVTGDLTLRWMSRDDLPDAPGIALRRPPAGPTRVEMLDPLAQVALLRAVQDATLCRPPLGGAVRLGDDFILVDSYPMAGTGEPLALLHLPDRPAVEARAVERATGLFGLTSAEAALCRRLMRGDTVEMHAETMRLSPWTVRTHLRNVFGKTGAGRQAELVALLHRLAR